MDTFLTKLYEEEMDKTAGSELNEFMQTLDREELEAFLIKEAVGGSAEVPLPDAIQGKELDAKQQAARKQVDKEHNSNPAPRHEETRTTNQVTKEAMTVADKAGRVLAKWATACKQSQGDAPEKAPIGEPPKEEKKEPGKLKQSQGDDDDTGMEVTARARTVTETAKRLGRRAKSLLSGSSVGQYKALAAGAEGSMKKGLEQAAKSERAKVWGTRAAAAGVPTLIAAKALSGKDKGKEKAASKIEALKGLFGRAKEGVIRGRALGKNTREQLKSLRHQKRPEGMSRESYADYKKMREPLRAAQAEKITGKADIARQGIREELGRAGAAGRHVGEHGKKYLAGAGVLTAAEIARRAAKGGEDKTASAQAQIVERSLRLTSGAPDHIKQAAAMLAGHQIALVKQAKEDKDYPVKPESWLKGQRGMVRATQMSGKGAKQILADKRLIKERGKGMGKGFLAGGAGGAGAGALAGLIASAATKGRYKPGSSAGIGALIGGLGGGYTGLTAGAHKANKKWLEERGIKMTGLGLGRGRFTEEAAKKYLKNKSK
jgi:hypothetical protein